MNEKLRLTAESTIGAFKGRRGFDEFWDECDSETRQEILGEIISTLESHLMGYSDQIKTEMRIERNLIARHNGEQAFRIALEEFQRCFGLEGK